MEDMQKITDDHWNKNVWHTSEGVAVISEDDYDRLVEKLIKNHGDIGHVSETSKLKLLEMWWDFMDEDYTATRKEYRIEEQQEMMYKVIAKWKDSISR